MQAIGQSGPRAFCAWLIVQVGSVHDVRITLKFTSPPMPGIALRGAENGLHERGEWADNYGKIALR